MPFTCLDHANVPARAGRGADVVHFDERLAFVLDATPGPQDLLDHPGGDAQWFALYLSARLIERFSDSQQAICSIHGALLDAQAEYRRLLGGRVDDAHSAPSASLALAVATPTHLELLRIGDAAIYRAGAFGEITACDHSRLIELEQRLGASLRGCMDQESALLRQMCAYRNIPQGYGVLSIGEAAMDYLEAEQLHARHVRELLLCSRGFWACFDPYDLARPGTALGAQAPRARELLERAGLMTGETPPARTPLHRDASLVRLRVH